VSTYTTYQAVPPPATFTPPTHRRTLCHHHHHAPLRTRIPVGIRIPACYGGRGGKLENYTYAPTPHLPPACYTCRNLTLPARSFRPPNVERFTYTCTACASRWVVEIRAEGLSRLAGFVATLFVRGQWWVTGGTDSCHLAALPAYYSAAPPHLLPAYLYSAPFRHLRLLHTTGGKTTPPEPRDQHATANNHSCAAQLLRSICDAGEQQPF